MVPGEARPAVDEMVALLPPTERARVPELDREQQKQGLGIIPEPGQLGYGSLVLYKELVKGGTLPGVGLPRRRGLGGDTPNSLTQAKRQRRSPGG